MNRIYVYHHLGLGDHIICNGLVREVAKKYDHVCVFCKNKNLTSVNDMYHDNPKIHIINLLDDNAVKSFLKISQLPVLRIGFTGENWNEHSEKHFDEVFYEQADIPFTKKYTSFLIDTKPMEKIDHPFIFMHDDPVRGFVINTNKIKSNLPIASPINDGASMFDYIQTLQEAEEIHCIDSSFLCLADILNVKGKKFFHKYARKVDNFSTPYIRNDWTVYA